MKKTSLLFVLIISTLLSFSQSYKVIKGDTVNYIDDKNLKQGKWFYYYENTEIINRKGFYKDNLKEGVWFLYYRSGNIKSEITYSANKKDGSAKIYYKNGNVAEEGTWRFNKWIGAYKSYYPEGTVSYEWNYNEKGERSGIQKYYHENGNVKIEGDWTEGKEVGILKEYYENGDLKSEKSFVEGEFDTSSEKTYKKEQNKSDIIVNTNVSDDFEENNNKNNNDENVGVFNGNGYHTFYNKFRQIEKKGTFMNGYLYEGKHFIYNNEGKLISTKIYEKGKVVNTIINKWEEKK